MYKTAIDILKKLDKLGYDAYIIGGYPRDYILNIECMDIDICTNALPDIIKANFEVISDNSQYGSLKIKENDFIYEITTFRKDLKYTGRYPLVEYVNTLEEDLKRRDFTINTICIDKNHKIIDLMGATNDLDDRIIKCIGDTENKLKEDPIRILRAIRLCGKLDFKLEENLKSNIIKYGFMLNDITKKQIKRELDKMNQKALDLLKQYNLEQYLK